MDRFTFQRGLVWFRRDLRVHDHTALNAALSECREVIPLFVFDEPLLTSHTFGAACISFMLSCLDDLSRSLAEAGLRLYWRRGDPTEELPRAAREFGASAVYWNRDYEPGTLSRDAVVANVLRRRKVEVRSFKDHVIFEAEDIRSAAGGPFQRYSAYRRRWWSAWRHAPPTIASSRRLLRARRTGAVAIGEWPSANDLEYQGVPTSAQGTGIRGRRTSP